MEIVDYVAARDLPAILEPGKAYRVQQEKVIIIVKEPAYREDVLRHINNPKNLPPHIRIYRMPSKAMYAKLLELISEFCFNEFKAEEAIQRLGWSPGSAYVWLGRLAATGALIRVRRSVYRVDETYCKLLGIEIPGHCT